MRICNWRSVLATAALAALVGVAGCSAEDGNPSATDSTGHAIGWRDTPPPSHAPPTNVRGDMPVGLDGSSSYAEPTNPLPPGGLPAPATQPQQQINNQASP